MANNFLFSIPNGTILDPPLHRRVSVVDEGGVGWKSRKSKLAVRSCDTVDAPCHL